jgi:lipoprotein-anchoring transpeptidase ErfK/SrfK
MKRYLLLGLAVALVALGITIYNVYPTLAFSQQFPTNAELTGIYTGYNNEGEFYGSKFFSEPGSSTLAYATDILGTNTSNKRIEVDLTNQRIYAFEGDRKIYDFLISSGKWGKTPTGTFRIWIKLRYTRMKGGSKALGTWYDLPNVPYTMFFSNNEVPSWRGFGIHGTYWHSNFGRPMSHGCINMKTEEVEKLYYWAEPVLGDKPSLRATDDNPGTPVIIYGKAPNN